MSTITIAVGKFSKKLTPDVLRLGTVGDVTGNKLVFTFDHFIDGFAVLDIVKPTVTSIGPERSFKFSLTKVGETYEVTIPTSILDTDCIPKIKLHIEFNDVEVFRSNYCTMYIDGNIPASISALTGTVSALGTKTNYVWTDWTPSLAWTTADPTTPTVVARYVKIDKTIFVSVSISSVDGKGATGCKISLPVVRALKGLKDVLCSTKGVGVIEDAELTINFEGFETATDGSPLSLSVNGFYETT